VPGATAPGEQHGFVLLWANNGTTWANDGTTWANDGTGAAPARLQRADAPLDVVELAPQEPQLLAHVHLEAL
jgi:hypothetical protein